LVGGTLQVLSMPAQGTTVRFSAPPCPRAGHGGVPPAPASGRKLAETGGDVQEAIRVVVVDDHLIMRQLRDCQ
jgi:hypothetical protein